MASWFSSLWQYITKHRVAIGVIGFVLVLVIVLIIVEVWFNGTGFNGYNQVTTAHTISGPSAGTVVKTEVYQPGKALWDWMQLLIIPFVLAIGGFWLNQIQKDREQKALGQHAQTERDIAQDNQQEAALQEYIDKMSELLLEKGLRKSGMDAEVRTIAQNTLHKATLHHILNFAGYLLLINRMDLHLCIHGNQTILSTRSSPRYLGSISTS